MRPNCFDSHRKRKENVREISEIVCPAVMNNTISAVVSQLGLPPPPKGPAVTVTGQVIITAEEEFSHNLTLLQTLSVTVSLNVSVICNLNYVPTIQ